ncbi:hypothetical protein [Niabella hirudinis]|uniref:hypothetical protein n=1 Tax=Niabella hirudinis TaxID=1285929 RepID=UPI003EBB37B7
MLQIIDQYRLIKENIPKLLDISGYRNDFIAKKIGLSASAFAVKKQRQSWTDKEVKDIVEAITGVNEDVEDYVMLEIMRSRKSEETLSLDDYKKLTAEWK